MLREDKKDAEAKEVQRELASRDDMAGNFEVQLDAAEFFHNEGDTDFAKQCYLKMEKLNPTSNLETRVSKDWSLLFDNDIGSVIWKLLLCYDLKTISHFNVHFYMLFCKNRKGKNIKIGN